MLLIVHKNLPVGNLREFIDYSKANQPKMQYGSAGAGYHGRISPANCSIRRSESR